MEMSCNESSCGILVVLEKQGTLYMRPAAMLTKLANQFESDVVLEHKKMRANGKSLLEIIALGIGEGASFMVFTSGRDALNAIQSIKNLFKRLFIDWEVTEAIAEEYGASGKCVDENIVNSKEAEMKQKKKMVEKLEKKRVQTFVWPLTGNVNEVCLAGDFNNWNPEPMTKLENRFLATVKLDPGVYQYKFVVDGQWQVDPCSKGNAQNDFGTNNSVVLVD